MTLQFGVLGPLAVWSDGEAVEINGREAAGPPRLPPRARRAAAAPGPHRGRPVGRCGLAGLGGDRPDVRVPAAEAVRRRRAAALAPRGRLRPRPQPERVGRRPLRGRRRGGLGGRRSGPPHRPARRGARPVARRAARRVRRPDLGRRARPAVDAHARARAPASSRGAARRGAGIATRSRHWNSSSRRTRCTSRSGRS